MNFKPLEKVFDGNPKPKVEKFELENGVIKKVDNEFGIITFSKEEVIDGLEYDFQLSERGRDGSWELGFGTEHGMLITNKGLGVYKHIIENIVILINTARKSEKIKKISFFGAGEELRVNEIEEFKNFLKSKKDQGVHAFDNFSYVENFGDHKKSIRIQNGMVHIEESGKGVRSLKDRLKGRENDYAFDEHFTIEQFVNNTSELSELLSDKEASSVQTKKLCLH